MSIRASRWMVAGAMIVGIMGCNREEPAVTPTDTTAQEAPAQRDDNWIATSVQAKYYADDALRGDNIEVDARSGVVTLRGEVESETAKSQAVQLARNVEGVTSVNDELRVASTTADATRPAGPDSDTVGTAGVDNERSPGWITTKIQAQYFVNPEIKPWNIDVTTNSGGVVVLQGEVDSTNDRQEAVRIARETDGVTKVDDRLRIKGEKAEAAAGAAGAAATGAAADRDTGGAPDPWITAKIQAKYFVDDEVKARNIDVDTNDGAVTLSGSVGSDAERRQALALARNTDGVRSVNDKLKVDPAMNRDRDVSEAAGAGAGAVAGEATRETREAAGEAKRETREAAGEAKRETAETRREAARAADMDVKRPDAWITTKIQAKYFLDGEVKGHEINVDTNNGVVTLKGSVETAERKKMAEDIARETEGVTRVVNQLTVAKR